MVKILVANRFPVEKLQGIIDAYRPDYSQEQSKRWLANAQGVLMEHLCTYLLDGNSSSGAVPLWVSSREKDNMLKLYPSSFELWNKLGQYLPGINDYQAIWRKTLGTKAKQLAGVCNHN